MKSTCLIIVFKHGRALDKFIMYSATVLAKKYIRYRFNASNGKGHGVHSPFVFDFIKNVLRSNKTLPFAKAVEARRSLLLDDKRVIEVKDFGAGSTMIKTNNRGVAAMAKSSLKPKKYAHLIASIIQHFDAKTVLELGTSFGITTSYLALANPNGKVYSFEGAPTIAQIAKEQFGALDIKNIELTLGDFDDTLTPFIKTAPSMDLFFLDGNHKKQPTLDYFERLFPLAKDSSIFIFDDIHWSEEMEAAWEEIKKDKRVTLTIDLFFIGIVFLKKEFLVKQDFIIKF